MRISLLSFLSSFKFSGQSLLYMKSVGFFLFGLSTSESDDSSESSSVLLLATSSFSEGAFLLQFLSGLFSLLN